MTTGSLEDFLEKNSGNNISDEDLNSCILPFFLKNIVTYGVTKKTLNQNIIKINSENSLNFTSPQVQYDLPAYINLFSKRNKNLLCEESFFYDQEENMLLFNRATPYVKLYKIFEKNDKYTEVYLPFEVVLKEEKTEFQEDLIQKILNGGGDGAVGIASFNWISDGRNDANKNQYSVNIKIIMQSINELEKIRNKDKEGNSVSILSLLYPVKEKNGKTTPDPENDTEVVDTKKQLIRAEIGYLLPQEYQQQYQNYFKTTLNLYLHKHNFSFHENGKVELDISYIANIENEFGNSVKWNLLENKDFKILKEDLAILKSLVFSNGKTIKTVEEIQKLGLTKKTFNMLTGGNKKPNYQINKNYVLLFIKQKEEEIAKIKISTFVDLLNNLIKKKKLNSYVLDANETAYLKSIVSISSFNEENLKNVKKLIAKLFKGISNNKTFPKPDEALKVEDVEEQNSGILNFDFFQNSKNLIGQKELEKKLKNLEGRTDADVASRVDFIFLGDLLQEIIDITLPEKQKEKFNIFLSPFGYIDYTSIKNSSLQNEMIFTKRKMPDGTQRKTLNIKGLKRHTHSMAYIPVSLPSIVRWWNREIVQKNETHYSLFKMFRTIVNRLIPESIGTRTAPSAPTQYFGTYNINYNTNEQVHQEVQKLNNTINIFDLSDHFSSRTNSMNNKDLYNNIAFISSREDPNLPNVYKGDFYLDCKKNIFHAQINNSTSIIKKASFKRDDNPKLETANLLASADGAPNEIIRQVYHCNLEMIGNNFFEPGSLIYIRPSFPGTNLQNEVLHKIGLGGYYRIIKIDNKISPSGYNTTLQCRWEMWGPRGLKQ